MTYCDWDAPDGASITGVLESFQVHVDAIHEVRYFEPDAGKFVA